MRYKFLGLIAFSLVLPGFVMSHSASAHADELNSRAVIVQEKTNRAVTFGNRFVQLNPQPEPPGSRGGGSNDH